MGPLSCVAGLIIRFIDDPAFSICWGPSSGGGGAGGATGNNKTNWRNSWQHSSFAQNFYQVNYDPHSYECNFCNCIEKPEKFRISTSFEPVTSRFRCDALTKWTMKPLTMAIAKIAFITEKIIALLDFKFTVQCMIYFIYNVITQFLC